jgi:23S rRNA-/tRNA-specific pseudouridylate synthase
VVVINDNATLGDVDLSVLISPKDRQLQKINIDKIRERIVYEDQNRLVFDKPAGILVHPGNQHWKDLCMNDYLAKMVETWKS